MSSLGSLLSGGGTGGRARQAAGSGNTRQRNPADVQNPPSASSGGGDRASSTPATVPVPAPAPGGAGAANPAIQLSDLQSILSNMKVPAGEPVSGGQAVDLATGMTGEALQPLLQNQEFLDKVSAE